MGEHVSNVLDLWGKPFSKHKTDLAAYAHAEQLEMISGLFSPGPHYYYVINMSNLNIEYISEGVSQLLGMEPGQVSIESLIERLVPEQREEMLKKEAVVVDFFYNYLPSTEVRHYKSVYHCSIRDVDGLPHKILHQAIPLNLTSDTLKPKHVLVVHTEVSHLLHHQRDSLNFINLNHGRSFYDVPYDTGIFAPTKEPAPQTDVFEALTAREKEVIAKIAEGYSTQEIAGQMHISIHTLRTHRKNILKKSNCKNIHELVAQSMMAGVI